MQDGFRRERTGRVVDRIAEIPTRLGLSSECDRQLLYTAAATQVAEHRDEILEFLNRP
jgi:hypothetical protein